MGLNRLGNYFNIYFPSLDVFKFDELFPMSYTTNRLTNQNKPASKKFRISSCIGQYKPEEIKVEVDGNQLKVHGKSILKCENGTDSYQFTRTFDLPDDVNIDTLTHRVTTDGVLVIKADRKQPEVRHHIKDYSYGNHLEIVFDVEGCDEKDVEAYMCGRELIVSAIQRIESDEYGVLSEKKERFYKAIKLSKDVDLNSLTSRLTNDGYLRITGKKRPKNALDGSQKLEIRRE